MRAFAILWTIVLALILAAPTSHAGQVDLIAWLLVGIVVGGLAAANHEGRL